MRRLKLLACLLAAPALACSRSSVGPAPGVASASAPSAVAGEAAGPVPSAQPTAPSGARAGDAAPGGDPGVAPGPSASAAQSAGPDGPPLPQVVNIGMHIGGGPNDEQTKAPIRRSVAPHLEEIGRCWRLAENADKPGDFGIDLRIPRDGGKAGVSHPRTAIKGEGFEHCVVDVFERIDFERPRGGDTVVSYSLRFTPTR